MKRETLTDKIKFIEENGFLVLEHGDKIRSPAKFKCNRCGCIFKYNSLDQIYKVERNKFNCPACGRLSSHFFDIGILKCKLQYHYGDDFEVIDDQVIPDIVTSKTKLLIKRKKCGHITKTCWDYIKHNFGCIKCLNENGLPSKRLSKENILEKLDDSFYDDFEFLNLDDYKTVHIKNIKIYHKKCKNIFTTRMRNVLYNKKLQRVIM